MTRQSISRSLASLFSGYIWLGIVTVLLTIVIDLQLPNHGAIVGVALSLVESIGIAIIVASIFTYVSGTSEFVDKIRNLLQDIVVSRNFLSNIDAERKREALNSLIKPSTEEKGIYSNIEDYLNTYVKQTMGVTDKCVRSNYTVDARAYVDEMTKKVCVCSNITYRLYPTKNGYSDIKVGFLESEIDSHCCRLVVNTPHGDREVFETLELKPVEIDAGKARLATVDLSRYAKDCTHLDISFDMYEFGTEKLIMLALSALQPTDGFRHKIRCERGLSISKFHTFIHGARFHVDQRSNEEVITTCNEWVNEGTGISLLVTTEDLAKLATGEEGERATPEQRVDLHITENETALATRI